jgi:hypothetical protein
VKPHNFVGRYSYFGGTWCPSLFAEVCRLVGKVVTPYGRKKRNGAWFEPLTTIGRETASFKFPVWFFSQEGN